MRFDFRKYSYYLPIVLALAILIGIWAGLRLAPRTNVHAGMFTSPGERYNKVTDFMGYVLNNYVDSVSLDDLSEEAITGILENLDPHSQYFPADMMTEVTEELMGNFEGIGIQFRIESDTINVIQTIDGGPSEKVGLLAGDRIVLINDSLVAGVGIKNEDAIGMLKGPRGTEVEVGIFRKGVKGLLDFNIVRDVIPTYSVDVAYMPSDTIGYIKVSRFSATTSEEFLAALNNLMGKGMTTLILDLRGNTGGYLNAATQMSDEFLPSGRLIVYTEGNNRPRNYSYATQSGHFEKQKLVILINEGSASASEIVAGAVQDNDRGTIIGRRSFGKGLVQEQLNLPDGSAVRLTIARYYTPSGRCIQRPYDNGKKDYYEDFYERFHNGEIQHPDSIHFNDSLKYYTLGGRAVYGGGGIMPDIYVPFNADEYPDYYNQLLDKGLIFRYAFTYTDTHRQELSGYENFKDFDNNFRIGESMFSDFVSYAEEKGIAPDTKGITESRERISKLMKAYIARNLFDDDGFYPIYNRIDEGFQRAMKFLAEK